MKIRWKLILSIVSVLLFFSLVFSLHLIEKERKQELNRLHAKIEVTNKLLKNILFAPLWDINEPMLRTNLELFYRDPEIVNIYLSEINKDIEIDLSDKSIGFNAEDIPHTLLIENDNVVIGELKITYTTAVVEKRLSNKRKELILITLGLMLFINGAIYLISSRMLRPIDHIVARLKLVDQGDFYSTLELKTKDEFNEIERYFNRMVATLKNEMGKRLQKEAELRKERDHSAEIIGSTPSMISVIGPSGEIRLINPAGERISGYDSEALMGRNFWQTFFPEEEYAQVERLFDLFGEKAVYDHEMILTTRDGHRRTISWSFIKRYDESGTLLSIIGFGDDVTERRKTEKALQESTAQLQQVQKIEAIGTLAGGIAHDFNNILSAILGYAQLAKMGQDLDEKTFDYLDKILVAGNRAKDLTLQILTFSRQGEQEFSTVQVEGVVREALKLLRASLPSTIGIEQRLTGDAVVMGNATQIHQIVMNLCTNAGHAMEEKGGILGVDLTTEELDQEVASRYPNLKPGPFVALTVRDTGHGMTDEVLERIFDPFYTTKQRGKGTGMGLSVVHGIVENHGGAITSWSRPGQGACFKVLLPAVERRLEPHRTRSSAHPRGAARILFIDDEKELADIGKEMLESLGYSVVAETDSLSALSLFTDDPHDFDLVITDMTMPNLTGETLAEKCMAARPDIRVILCTGYSARISREIALGKGIRAYMMKPLNLRMIAETVREVLDPEDDRFG